MTSHASRVPGKNEGEVWSRRSNRKGGSPKRERRGFWGGKHGCSSELECKEKKHGGDTRRCATPTKNNGSLQKDLIQMSALGTRVLAGESDH